MAPLAKRESIGRCALSFLKEELSEVQERLRSESYGSQSCVPVHGARQQGAWQAAAAAARSVSPSSRAGVAQNALLSETLEASRQQLAAMRGRRQHGPHKNGLRRESGHDYFDCQHVDEEPQRSTLSILASMLPSAPQSLSGVESFDEKLSSPTSVKDIASRSKRPYSAAARLSDTSSESSCPWATDSGSGLEVEPQGCRTSQRLPAPNLPRLGSSGDMLPRRTGSQPTDEPYRQPSVSSIRSSASTVEAIGRLNAAPALPDLIDEIDACLRGPCPPHCTHRPQSAPAHHKNQVSSSSSSDLPVRMDPNMARPQDGIHGSQVGQRSALNSSGKAVETAPTTSHYIFALEQELARLRTENMQLHRFLHDAAPVRRQRSRRGRSGACRKNVASSAQTSGPPGGRLQVSRPSRGQAAGALRRQP